MKTISSYLYGEWKAASTPDKGPIFKRPKLRAYIGRLCNAPYGQYCGPNDKKVWARAHGIGGKEKFGTYVYEFPPQIGIGIFGICLILWTELPDDCFEAILEYNYGGGRNCFMNDVPYFIASRGHNVNWHDGERYATMCISKDDVNDAYSEAWYSALSMSKASHDIKIRWK